MSKTLIIRPRLSEKTYGLSNSRVYVFDIPRGTNKHEVARAVEAQFEVKVSHVNVANIAGKSKRTISLTGKRVVQGKEGKQNNTRKAYVTLLDGYNLPFFAAVEEAEEKQEEAQEKVSKAMDKQAKSKVKDNTKSPRRSLSRRANKQEQEDDK